MERGFFATCVYLGDKLIRALALRITPFFFRIDPKKIVFLNFSGNYDCNPAAICDEVLREIPEAKIVWGVYETTLTGPAFFPRQVKTLKRGTWSLYKELFSARVIVDNGVSAATLHLHKKKGQILIETWHGSLGIKKFGRDSNKDTKWLRTAEKEGRMTDYIISNSAFEDEIYREDFWTKTPIWQFGHPRNDILFCKDEKKIAALRQRLNERYALPEHARLCLYAPTFRDDNDTSAYIRNFRQLKAALETRFGGEWVILTRLHYRTRKMLAGFLLSGSVTDVGDYVNIAELMLMIDAGITDYSSWICEYMLRRKPGFMFAPDADLYASKDRSLFFPLTALPFPAATDEETLVKNILTFDEAKFRTACDTFLAEKGSVDDGNASARTAAEIKKLSNS